jgi:hypothetical protein
MILMTIQAHIDYILVTVIRLPEAILVFYEVCVIHEGSSCFLGAGSYDQAVYHIRW